MSDDERGGGQNGRRRSMFEWPYDRRATLIWSAVGFGLIIAAGFVANGLAFGHWTLNNLPVFNRGSDVGFLTWLGLIAVELIVGVAAVGFVICRTAWRYRRAGHAAVEAQFNQHHQSPIPGPGRTGAGHVTRH